MEKKQKIILDCDPGHDDAIALLLAARHPGLELLAITTVAGNQTLEKTTRNALSVCTLAHIRDVPVARGMAQPLVREARYASDIHGESGLDGPALPQPEREAVPEHAVDLIIDLVRSTDDVVLVATGPLTNVASAITREPAILSRLKGLYLMGGAIGLGNVSPAAEFNIYFDPEAAAIVFNSGCPITMIPLEVTHQALATPAILERLRALGRPVPSFVCQLLEFFGNTYRQVFGFTAPPVHDPCAVAALIDPTLVSQHSMYVAIETRGEYTLGRTVCDVYGVLGRRANACVGYGLDAPRFWELLIETLASYGEESASDG
ncbi:MAG: nucleoside hydrolase [Thermogemmatispora sp.]|jgi:inosine-uridine nucleoside N-ribohydrolase|uniref:Ribosylpyrimidine nucleosidase n=1 Tax=Thermogemmatispora aurantia TaxID=2045279 RepID=A0A5J4K8E3_9CHLR|nr:MULTISPECIES: nucleoside hydrolase [Thermogemmatispora]MBE3565720.1 nucleoside hydrolase [Thermogemmatispora sp.]GER82979.1 ribosylpyrimidine nucleosidase [Thermogemmatispora aurantia]